MIAASVWSLIIPAIEMSEEAGTISWLPATIGIILGTVFIPFCDKIINYEKINLKSSKENFMLALAIVIHNIPEGMAVGVAFASAIYGNFEALIMSAFVLSIGIAIQNFPEGAAISLPYRSGGMSRGKSFLLGMLSRISGANCRIPCDCIRIFCRTTFAIFLSVCRRYNDLCCCRRNSTRVQWEENRDICFSYGIFNYDDIRCCFRIE